MHPFCNISWRHRSQLYSAWRGPRKGPNTRRQDHWGHSGGWLPSLHTHKLCVLAEWGGAFHFALSLPQGAPCQWYLCVCILDHSWFQPCVFRELFLWGILRNIGQRRTLTVHLLVQGPSIFQMVSEHCSRSLVSFTHLCTWPSMSWSVPANKELSPYQAQVTRRSSFGAVSGLYSSLYPKGLAQCWLSSC